MDAGRPPSALDTAWNESALSLDPHESVLVPPHAITLLQVQGLCDLRLYAHLPEHGFRCVGELMSVAERMPPGKQQGWQIRIQDFIIDKDLRGRGIGSHMLTLLVQLARGEMDRAVGPGSSLAGLLPTPLNESQGFRRIWGELSSRDAIDGSVAHLKRFYELHGFEVSRVPGPGGILATIRLDIPPRREVATRLFGARVRHDRYRRSRG